MCDQGTPIFNLLLLQTRLHSTLETVVGIVLALLWTRSCTSEINFGHIWIHLMFKTNSAYTK